MDEDTGPTVAEFIEYCQVQAGLLSGKVERLGEEATELLAEIDERTTEIRARLEGGPPATDGPSASEGPGVDDLEVAELEDLQADLERKQSLVEAKQARIDAFQQLAASYTDLAIDLESSVETGETALERVVQFEVEHDAPAYFPDRETLCETVATSAEDDRE
ncbi:hypothetical protein ACYJ1Y_05615 [Natrialbaceae archaeon A-gly3]